MVCEDNYGGIGDWKQFGETQREISEREFTFGCKCAEEFLKTNFMFSGTQTKCISSEWQNEQCEEFARNSMTLGDSPLPLDCLVSPQARNVPLLWIALEYVYKNECESISAECRLRWKLRVLALWQRCTSELSAAIRDAGNEMLNKSQQIIEQMCPKERALFFVEAALFSAQFRDMTRAKDYLVSAMESSGVKVELSGALGRRTQFQQKPVAQLTLTVTGSKVTQETAQPPDANLPLSVSLNDDTLLEKMKLEEEVMESWPVDRLQQAIVATSCVVNGKSKAKDEMLKEEQRAYVEWLVCERLDWSLTMGTLVARCGVEASERRTVERAMSQAEAIINTIDTNSEQSCGKVTDYSWMMQWMTPLWKLRQLHCSLLMSLGCVSEALAIYNRLKDYDGMVTCYSMLDRKQQAVALLNDMLDKSPSDPRLLCTLGDVTRDPKHYAEAWKASNHRYARAMLSCGKLYIDRKRITEAFDCLELGLELLPLHWSGWFGLGYCALQLKKFDIAAKAFHRCVSLEPDDAQSWNNLAAAYLHQNLKERAFPVLQEALKYSHDDYRLWENVMTVAVDTRRFGHGIQAYHRILDLNPKFIDVDVLEALVKHAKDTNGVELAKLLGRVTAGGCTNAHVWCLYSELYSEDASNVEKYVQLLQKAHAQYSRQPTMDDNTFNLWMHTVILLAKAKLTLDTAENRSSVRMLVKGTIARYNKQYDHLSEENTDTQMLANIQQLNDIIANIES